ncbi:ATP-binding protein [Marinobacter sp. SS5-14b]|uniref:ATP-binding protein n=1 Tax=Marinobacter sp. SS5-14b TaxID=3050456 RepID=UPI0026DF21B7|nr:ATP-binding protein [Marinobacter sp. SS5-14b]
MGIEAIKVDQRVIDIDSRRFASVEKALVELITNSDDSYARLERLGEAVSGVIHIEYERHQNGAMLVVADQAEGMTWQQALASLSYGGAHSPLARGEGTGRGYFGRGLKQAIFGLGYGWLETLHHGRYTRIDLFRGESGEYLYDDGDGDRDAKDTDYQRMGTDTNGTRIVIVIDNPLVHVSQYRSVLMSVTHNIYLREILGRRQIELIHRQAGKEVERTSPVHFLEPEARVLIGPQQPCSFVHEQETYPFNVTLKRSLNAELTLRGDEREGLNLKDPFVAAFARAVSKLIRPAVVEEREHLRHLEYATASGRTDHMIEHLLERMNRAAIQDMQVALPSMVLTASITGRAGRKSRYTTTTAMSVTMARPCLLAMSSVIFITSWNGRFTARKSAKYSSIPRRQRCSCTWMAVAGSGIRPGCCWRSCSWMSFPMNWLGTSLPGRVGRKPLQPIMRQKWPSSGAMAATFTGRLSIARVNVHVIALPY